MEYLQVSYLFSLSTFANGSCTNVTLSQKLAKFTKRVAMKFNIRNLKITFISEASSIQDSIQLSGCPVNPRGRSFFAKLFILHIDKNTISTGIY